jgi:hypothetical protein
MAELGFAISFAAERVGMVRRAGRASIPDIHPTWRLASASSWNASLTVHRSICTSDTDEGPHVCSHAKHGQTSRVSRSSNMGRCDHHQRVQCESQDVPWNIEELATMDCHSRDRGKFPSRVTEEMRVVVCVIAS